MPAIVSVTQHISGAVIVTSHRPPQRFPSWPVRLVVSLLLVVANWMTTTTGTTELVAMTWIKITILHDVTWKQWLVMVLVAWKEPATCLLAMLVWPREHHHTRRKAVVMGGVAVIIICQAWMNDVHMLHNSTLVGGFAVLWIMYSYIIRGLTDMDNTERIQLTLSCFILSLVIKSVLPLIFLVEFVPPCAVMETIQVFPKFGIQLSTTYGTSTTQQLFIVMPDVVGVLFNEAFHRCRVVSYLALQTRQGEYIVLFPESRPEGEHLMTALHALDAALTPPHVS